MKIAVDFDHTIYDRPEKEAYLGELKGSPLPGAIEALEELMADNDVYVLTARPDLERVKAWLKKEGLDLKVTNKKEPSDVYIDDKAIAFEGDWEEILEKLEEYA